MMLAVKPRAASQTSTKQDEITSPVVTLHWKSFCLGQWVFCLHAMLLQILMKSTVNKRDRTGYMVMV